MALVRIGTRSSALAQMQAREVERLIRDKVQTVQTEIVLIKTSGDLKKDIPLCDIGGKGLFLKELEEALLKQQIDVAVHSMKDVPAFYSELLDIPCMLPRLSPFDVFLSQRYSSFSLLPKGATIATCSVRRKVQLLRLRPDLNIEPLRGNINTRIAKLQNFDGIILAEAGLIRIERQDVIKERFSVENMLSAVGQGCIGVQCRSSDVNVISMLKSFNHHQSYNLVTAERGFMKGVNGSCTTPLAAFAEYIGDEDILLRCMLSDGKEIFYTQRLTNEKYAEQSGFDAAVELLAKFIN